METDTYLGESGVVTKDFDGNEFYPLYRAGYPVTGCCGALQVYSMEEFNCPYKWNKNDFYWSYDNVKNKGFLLYLNPENPEEIEDLPTSIVEKIQLGEDTLYLRLKVQCD